jgi:polycystin 1L2
MKIDDCNLPYTWYNEAKNPFGFNINTDGQWDYSRAFKYTESDDKTLIYSTSYATYMAGGYVHEIVGGKPEKVILEFENLRNHSWIDRYTRAVFLTFGLYNPNVNLFVYCSLLLEQLPTTFELILRPSFQPFKLVQLYTGTDLIYCLIYLILILYYMYAEIKLIFEMRKAYIKQFWSYINWAIIFCSWFGVVIHIFRQTEMKKMVNSLKDNKEKTGVNLQFFSYLDSLLTYLLGFCCFFGTIKM